MLTSSGLSRPALYPYTPAPLYGGPGRGSADLTISRTIQGLSNTFPVTFTLELWSFNTSFRPYLWDSQEMIYKGTYPRV